MQKIYIQSRIHSTLSHPQKGVSLTSVLQLFIIIHPNWSSSYLTWINMIASASVLQNFFLFCLNWISRDSFLCLASPILFRRATGLVHLNFLITDGSLSVHSRKFESRCLHHRSNLRCHLEHEKLVRGSRLVLIRKSPRLKYKVDKFSFLLLLRSY